MPFSGSNRRSSAWIIIAVISLQTIANSTCSVTYEYAANNLDVYIPPDGSWVFSSVSLAQGANGAKVECIDIYYEIFSGSTGLLYAEISDSDWNFVYVLENGIVSNGSKRIVMHTEIPTFNGRDVGQQWILWLKELGGTGNSFLGRWWIKVYYQGGSTGQCGDLEINLVDMAYMANAWLSKIGDENWNQSCDTAPLGGDGIIDYQDLVRLVEQWLR